MPPTRPNNQKTTNDKSADPTQLFQDLTRKLVNVPKEELDREEEKYQHDKKQRQAKSQK